MGEDAGEGEGRPKSHRRGKRMKPEKREGEESRGAGKKCEICQEALVVVQLLRPSPEKAGQGHGRRGLTSLLFWF